MIKQKSGQQIQKLETTQTPVLETAFKGPRDSQINAEDDIYEKIQSSEEAADYKENFEELTLKIETLNDKYVRLMAEFDNYKRRSARDYDHIVATANEALIKDIIEVRENFEYAFSAKDKGEKFVEGMELTFAKLNSILEKYGLEVYGKPGNAFDPELHNALIHSPHASIPHSHISDVHERGYKLKGKIIKHAQVVVSSGKPEQEED
jgi:molecular chaperone GrpE